MGEAVFTAFEAFDFENNGNFQKGWSSVKTLFDSGAIEREYLRAKAFFFSKYIMQFDIEKYLAWKSDNGNCTQVNTCKCAEKKEKSDGAPKTAESSSGINEGTDKMINSDCVQTEVVYQHPPLLPASQPSKENEEIKKHDIEESGHFEKNSSVTLKSNLDNDEELNAETKIEPEKDNSLSLAELAVLLQNGLPIPGLIKVDVQPTNMEPSPSTLKRKPKPWELKKSGDKFL